ncbi:hypothetical protein VSR34_15005 [Paraburkholderia sp. JHI2823]
MIKLVDAPKTPLGVPPGTEHPGCHRREKRLRGAENGSVEGTVGVD